MWKFQLSFKIKATLKEKEKNEISFLNPREITIDVE